MRTQRLQPADPHNFKKNLQSANAVPYFRGKIRNLSRKNIARKKGQKVSWPSPPQLGQLQEKPLYPLSFPFPPPPSARKPSKRHHFWCQNARGGSRRRQSQSYVATVELRFGGALLPLYLRQKIDLWATRLTKNWTSTVPYFCFLSFLLLPLPFFLRGLKGLAGHSILGSVERGEKTGVRSFGCSSSSSS